MGKHNLSAILATAALLSGSVLLHVPNAHAEGDWPYSGSSSQDFDNDYRTYKRNDGYSTNFVNELVPLSTFGNDGRLKFESRDVEQRGSQATRFDNSNTGLQLDFNF